MEYLYGLEFSDQSEQVLFNFFNLRILAYVLDEPTEFEKNIIHNGVIKLHYKLFPSF